MHFVLINVDISDSLHDHILIKHVCVSMGVKTGTGRFLPVTASACPSSITLPLRSIQSQKHQRTSDSDAAVEHTGVTQLHLIYLFSAANNIFPGIRFSTTPPRNHREARPIDFYVRERHDPSLTLNPRDKRDVLGPVSLALQ